MSDVFEIAATGEKFVFTKRPRDTNGELLEIEFQVRHFAPPAHVHTKLEERVEVISGRAWARIGREERVFGPGESFVFAAGVAHTFRAEGDELLHFRCEVRPPLQMETLFETTFGLYRDGKANKHGQPNLLQNVVLAQENDGYLAGPPIWLQKPAIAVAAAIARLFGYRARYDKYSGPESSG